MATIRQLCTNSMKRLNAVRANQPPTAYQIENARSTLDTLIDSLSNELLNIHTISPYRFLLTPGQKSYKLGPALDDSGNPTNADWVIERPMRIETAVVMVYPTLSGTPPNVVIGENQQTIFYNLMLANYSQYADLTVRNITSTWPTEVYDNGAYPCRELSVWPVPQNEYAIELWLWQPLATYASIDEELNLPPGYERYLTLKLAMELAPELGKEVTDTLRAALGEAESAIKTLNQQVTKTGASNAFKNLSGQGDSWMVSNDAPANFPSQY